MDKISRHRRTIMLCAAAVIAGGAMTVSQIASAGGGKQRAEADDFAVDCPAGFPAVGGRTQAGPPSDGTGAAQRVKKELRSPEQIVEGFRNSEVMPGAVRSRASGAPRLTYNGKNLSESTDTHATLYDVDGGRVAQISLKKTAAGWNVSEFATCSSVKPVERKPRFLGEPTDPEHMDPRPTGPPSGDNAPPPADQ